MKQVKCLILRGPSGVGKTTLAKKLSDDFSSPTEYLNCDRLRRELFGDDKWQKEYKVKIVEEVAKKAKRILSEGKNVIIDDIIEYPEQLDILRKELPEAQWILLEGELETLLERDESRKRREDDQGHAGEEAIKYLHEHYLREPIEGEISINTENKTENEIHQEIRNKV